MSWNRDLTFEEQEKFNEYKLICEQNLLQEADVVCCTLISSGKKLINSLLFDMVIIDEATQSFEPENLIPLTHKAKKIILIGDQNQLGPNLINDQELSSLGYGRGLFERLLSLYQNTKLFGFLNSQYRMHPLISDFPNKKFYNGLIENGISEIDRVGFLDPIIFIDINSKENKKGTSYENEKEALEIYNIYNYLNSKNVEDKDIGIISPYSGQTKLIRKKILGLKKKPELKIASVDSFQGNERNYMIISLTRTKNKEFSHFFLDKRRINVTLTRAKYSLIIVGNSNSFINTSNIWNDFILYCKEKNYFKQSFMKIEKKTNEKISFKINDDIFDEEENNILNPFLENDKGFEISEFNNQITQSKTRIIWPNNKSDLEYLKNWTNKLFKKLNNGKFINLSFDTEFVCFQFGEVFVDNFDIFQKNDNIPEIGNNEILIIFYYTKEGKFLIQPILEILKPLLEHQNLTLLTFDFINDITKLIKFGFNINFKRIFDAQTYSIPIENNNIITFTDVFGLSDIITLMDNNDDFHVPNSKKILSEKGKLFNWDVNKFLIKIKKYPKTSIVTEEFLNYSSNDIPLTALACKYILLNFEFYQSCIINTEKKIDEFRINLPQNIKINKYIRQASFVRPEISIIMNRSIEESHSTNSLLKNWSRHQKIYKILKFKDENIPKILRLQLKDINWIENRLLKLEEFLKEKEKDLLEVRLLNCPPKFLTNIDNFF